MNNEDRCIHRLFERQASRTPAVTAVIFDEQRITYGELNARANRVAHYLRGSGVGPETLVGICSNRTPEMLIGMLGILKAGGAYVALDPAYPAVRLAFMIEDAAMPVLLTQQDLLDTLPVTDAKLICLDRDWGSVPDTNPDTAVTENNLAYVLYTSGSTGRPKGVAIEHHSVVVFLDWAHSVFPQGELRGTLAGTSICFDLSVFEIFVPLTCGGTVILAENAVALPTLPARGEVTLINTVPSAMTALVDVGGVPDGVRVVNLAGEPLTNKLVQDVYRSGSVEKVYNLYGPSEDTTYSTFVLAAKGADKNPTIGRPIDGTQAYIVDEQLQLAPAGTAGELCLGGEGLARGYLHRPDLTDAKFIPNPFGPGRIYRTGDLARYVPGGNLPDGDIEFLGRMDYQVKVRGFRIELGEIEAALEQYPGVERAVVLALPDARAELQLAAWIVPNDKAAEALPAGEEDMREHVALWRNVYEDTYREPSAAQDPTFNTSGWRSSYTGEPIPEAEMREWLAETVRRILELRPRKVLEIGCGTGMLLARIAPLCESYVGLDISRTGLDHIRSMQSTIPGLERIELLERAADELDDLAAASFDTVVINSVAQHFPDADYLIRVVEGAARAVKPGGHVFLGDLINYSLLEPFHTSIQVHRADDSDTCAEVKERIRRLVAQARDLTVAPQFFLALARRNPAIGQVEAWPKAGRFHNELTRFRYDAILHIGEDGAMEAGAEKDAERVWLDWQRQKLTVAEVRRLAETYPETLAIRNIPNARLDREVMAMSWLRESAPDEPIARLRSWLDRPTARGIEPEDVRAIGELGYRVDLSWLNAGVNGTFEALLMRRDVAAGPAVFPQAAGLRLRSCAEYVSHPERAKLNRQLIPEVRKHLREKLPHYMMPANFSVLEKLPLSPTGKVDRRALAQIPVRVDSDLEDIRPVTEDPLEELLVHTWADVLNLGRVGRDDNFFELGGDSLKAMALTHRMQRKLNLAVRPVALMQAPTVARFAAWLKGTYPGMTLDRGTEMLEGEI
jgi:amino acid adenylation domain-containing protein